MTFIFIYRSHEAYLQTSIFNMKHACFHRSNSAMNMLGKNKSFDLNGINKQMHTLKMSFDKDRKRLCIKNKQNFTYGQALWSTLVMFCCRRNVASNSN